MAKVLVEIELVGDEQAAARIQKIGVAQANLERAFLQGRISREQHTRSTRELGNAERLLGVGLNTTTQQLGTARVATQAIRSEQQRASESVQLLAGRFGVELPRSVGRYIASLKGIAPVAAS